MPDSSATLQLIVQLQVQGQQVLSQIGGQLTTVQQQAQAVAQVDPWQQMQQTAQAQTAIETLGGRVDKLLAQVGDLTKAHPSLKFDDNVDSVKTQLTYLQDQLKELGTKPATVEIKAEISQARAQLAAVTRDFQTIQRENAVITPKVNSAEAVAQLDLLKGAVMGVNSQVGMLVAGGGLLIAGQMAVEAFKESVNAAIEWQTKLNELQGNTTLTNAQMASIKNTIHDMVASSNADMNQLADGMMHATNLGFSVADSQAIADSAFKSSASTGAQLGSTMNAVASVMKEYDMHAKDASVATDLLHNAAAQGNMTMEQFVDAGGKTIATAANLGDKLDDVSAAYAALTRHGEDAAMAGTNITGMLVHIVAPSSAARSEIEALSKATGVDLVSDFSQAGLQAKGLSGIMQDVAQATNGDSSEILKLIPALRGGQGALVLAGTGAQDFNDILKSQADIISGKSTPTLDAFNRTTHTTGYELGEAANQAKLFSLAVGDNLVQAVALATQGLTHMDDVLGQLGQAWGNDQQTSNQFYNLLSQAAAKQQEVSAAADAATAAATRQAQAMETLGSGYYHAGQQIGQGTATAATGLLQMSDDAAKGAATVASALDKMAKDTDGAAKTGTKGINDLFDLIRHMPDNLSPDMDKLRQEMTGTLADIQKQGGISAKGLHDDVVGWAQQMAQSADLETRAMGQAMLEDMATTAANAKSPGINTGINWIDGLMSGISSGQPAVDQYVSSLLKEFDLKDAFAILGDNAAKAFGNKLAFGTANFIRNIGDSLVAGLGGPNSPVGKMLAGQFDAAANHIVAIYGEISHQYAGFTGVTDTWSKNVGANHDKVKKSTADVGKQTAQTMEQIVQSVGAAAKDTEGPSASMAKGLADILTVARERVPADAKWIQSAVNDLIKSYQAGTLTAAQENAAMRAILEKLTHDKNVDLSLLAQSQLDNLQKMETAASDKAEKTAAKLSAEYEKATQSVIGSFGKLAEDSTKKNATVADGWLTLLDTLKQATDSKIPGIPDKINKELARVEAGQASLQELHDFALQVLGDIRDGGDVISKQFAAAQIADIQAADAAAQAAVQKQKDGVLDKLTSLVDDASKPDASIGGLMQKEIELMQAATDAGLPQVNNVLQKWFAAQKSGATLNTADMVAQVTALYQQLVQSGDQEGAALEQVWQEHTKAIQKAQTAAAQAAEQAQLDIVKSLGSLGSLLNGQTVSAPKVLEATYELIQKLQAGGHGDWAGQLQKDADAVARGVPGALDRMNADVLARLEALESSSDPVMAAWARDMVETARKTAQDVAAQTAQAVQQASTGLAGGLEKIGADLLSGSASPLAILNQLAPLMKQATDAGMSGVADRIRYWMQVAASGGTVDLQQMLTELRAALDQLAQSADPTVALFARQQEALLAAAAAAASYTGAIQAAQATLTSLQAAAKDAQDALTASSKAVQDQQAVVQGLQAQWNAAKQAIQDYQSVKLAGETGSNQQIQQAGYKVDTAQLQLLQAQAAGLSGDALKPYQDAVQQAQLQLQLLQQQAKVTYQPLHDQLKAAADAANGLNKEMAFPDALKGIQDQGAAMARLGPAIAGATKHLDALKESQAQAQAAVAAANAAVQQQQQVLQQLQQAQQAAAQGTQAVASGMQAVNSSLAQTGPALATVGPAVQGMLTGMGTSLDAQMVAADKSTIWGKWWGPSGLLGVMLARLGNTGQSGVQGGGFSFIPNVIAAFRGLLEAQLPGLLAADLPPMTQTWAQWLQQMKDATQTFVPDMTTVGNNLIQGIAAGITSGTHFVVEAAQNAVKAAIAAANAQAESKSPSERAAREVGLPLAQGMAVGIQRGIPTIAAAAQAAVNAALPGASGGLVGAGAGAGIGTFAPTIYVSVGGGPWQLGTATASLTPGALSEDLAFERRNRRAGNP